MKSRITFASKKDALWYAVAMVFIALIAVQGVRAYKDATTTTDAERTEAASRAESKAKEQADWDVSPLNPKYIAKVCIERGGIPTFSAWDNRVTSCKGAGESKEVNIEVNQ